MQDKKLLQRIEKRIEYHQKAMADLETVKETIIKLNNALQSGSFSGHDMRSIYDDLYDIWMKLPDMIRNEE